MKATVVFKALLERREGESANGPWVRQPIVTKTMGENPKDVVFTFNGDKISETLQALRPGEVLEVHFEPESREYTKGDGTKAWVTDLRAWGVQRYARMEG